MAVVLSAPDAQDPSVRIITLNRPDVMNAFNGELFEALLDAIDAADIDPAVRVIIVTGAGRVFCAGADFREGFTSEIDGGGLNAYGGEIDGVQRDTGGVLNLRIFACDTPIIGAVNGSAVGVGATMLLPMDMRIASNMAKFSIPFARRGIVFDGCGSWFLPRLVGFAKAQEWVLRGHLFPAQEALDAGLINQLVEPEDVLSTALDIARDIAQNCAPQSVAINKQLLRASMLGHGTLDHGPMQAHMMESRNLNQRFLDPDCQEGVTAFLEKRAPKFTDQS